MKTIRLFAVALLAISLVNVSGCVKKKYDPATFQLPERTSQQHALIFGRIETKDEKKTLKLSSVAIQRWGNVYFNMGHMPKGEENFVTTNNYFVVPNVAAGKYFFKGFVTGNVFNNLPHSTSELFNVKPGAVHFVGSYDYTTKRNSIMGVPGKYSLENAKKPTELDLLQWLYQSSLGTGWEKDIAQRIRNLGGKPMSRAAK